MPEKAPAFQLYARKWLEGCQHMTLGAQGAYMRLLCHQWERGALPSDHGQLARLLGVTRRGFVALWSEIGEKFPGMPPANPQLEEVRAKQRAYAESRRAGGYAHAHRVQKTCREDVPPLTSPSPVSGLKDQKPFARAKENPGSDRHRDAGQGVEQAGDIAQRIVAQLPRTA